MVRQGSGVGQGRVVFQGRDDGRGQGQRGGRVGERRVVAGVSVAQSVDAALLGCLGVLGLGFFGGERADGQGQEQDGGYELQEKKRAMK